MLHRLLKGKRGSWGFDILALWAFFLVLGLAVLAVGIAKKRKWVAVAGVALFAAPILDFATLGWQDPENAASRR